MAIVAAILYYILSVMFARQINFTPVDIPITLSDSAVYRTQFHVDEPAPYRVVLSVLQDKSWAFMSEEIGVIFDSLGNYFDSMTIQCVIGCSTDSVSALLSRKGSIVWATGPVGDSSGGRIELNSETEHLDTGKTYDAVIAVGNVPQHAWGLKADLRIKMLDGWMKDIAVRQSAWVAVHLIPLFGALVISFICLILWVFVYRKK